MSVGTWSYDGSLDGFLILAAKAAEEGEAPEAVANALAPDGDLFALLGPPPLEFPADRDIGGASTESRSSSACAERAASHLRALSGELFDLVLTIWMSEESLELPMLQICAEVGRRGRDVIGDHGDPRIRVVVQTSRRVIREIHRLIGLIRFSRRSDGTWSAPIEPDHNVIAALIPHFIRRFNGESFAVVDVKRHLAIRSTSGATELFSGRESLTLLPDAADHDEARLWKRYFQAVDNPARRNPALQRRLMPVRYWKYLPEFAVQTSTVASGVDP